MEIGKIKQAKERYDQIEKIISGNVPAEGLLNRLTCSAVRYIDICANMTARVKRLEDSERCRADAESTAVIDKEKRYSHEALISNLNVFNRYLFKEYDKKVPEGGIYSLPRESIKDRHSVGDWAGYLVFGLKDYGGNL